MPHEEEHMHLASLKDNKAFWLSVVGFALSIALAWLIVSILSSLFHIMPTIAKQAYEMLEEKYTQHFEHTVHEEKN